MMNWLKSIFRPVRRLIQARFNSASTSESSMRNFAGADYYSADAAMQRHIRLLIAVRARNEFANNSFAYGIINTLADDTIGTGPRLQLENDESLANISDKKAASLQHIERRFHQWADAVDLNGLLRCARIAKAVDGETFIRLLRNPGADREIQLEPRIFEAECVASETLAETPYATSEVVGTYTASCTTSTAIRPSTASGRCIQEAPRGLCPIPTSWRTADVSSTTATSSGPGSIAVFRR